MKNTRNFIEKINPLKIGKLLSDGFLKDEQAKFRLITTLKILGISLLTLIIQALIILMILRIDLHFFSAYNISGLTQFEAVFYDYTLSSIYNSIWEIIALVIFITILAMYISKLVLRPFRTIGNYCEKYVKNSDDASYDPDFFTDLKILTRFSEYFFLQIDNGLKNNSLPPADVPSKYKKIYKPRFEFGFFMHFLIIVLFISTLTSAGVYALTAQIYEAIVNLAINTLVLDSHAQVFLTAQKDLFRIVSGSIIGIHLIFYISLSFNLYGKVSAPAFAIFATMRAFLKGNKKARVHLIGSYHARPETKKLNQYLDYIEKNITSSD